MGIHETQQRTVVEFWKKDKATGETVLDSTKVLTLERLVEYGKRLGLTKTDTPIEGDNDSPFYGCLVGETDQEEWEVFVKDGKVWFFKEYFRRL
jgi:hypothetical protein